MKTYQSRRKFIATAISGSVASVVAPMAFAGEPSVSIQEINIWGILMK